MSPADVQAVIDRACEQDPEFVRRLTTLASAPGAAPEPVEGQPPAVEAVPPYPSVSADPRPVLCISRGAGERGRQ